MEAHSSRSGSSISPSAQANHSAVGCQRARFVSSLHPIQSAFNDCSMTTRSVDDIDRSYFPSLVQRDAILVLQQFEDEEVVAWLKLLRSLQPDYQHRPDHQQWSPSGCLSSQQLDAASTLRDCPNGLVLAWLRSSRLSGGSNGGRTPHNSSSPLSSQVGNPSSSRNLRHRSPSSTPQSSSSSMGPPSSINTYGGHNPPRSFWSLGGSSLELSREQSLDGDTSPASTTNVQKHNHWCFDCEDSKTYDTCDGFKRHVKEHITMYPCMPHGAIEDTGRGPRCVFCGIPSPDEAHLDTHSIKPCAARTIKARSYTRQANLTKHLKVHGVSEGSHLAKKWRHTIPKRYFSCGFCVSLFSTINKQTNHIDDHYKKSEHIRDWDHNKVVRGLLLEPEVKNAMQNHLASDTRFGLCWDLSCFSWELPVAKDLQHRLQLREETEEVLAKSVFDLGRYKCNHYDLNGWPTSMTFSNQQMDLSLDYQVAFAADTTSVPATSSRLPACSSSQHQASTTSWGTANGFGLSVSSQYDVAPIQTGNSGVCSAVDYQQSETREYPAFPSTGNSNTAPSPAPTAPLWIGSTPTLIENHSSHMPMQTYFHQGDHWQSSQSTCAGPMPSSTSAGMIPHPANPRVGDSCNTNAVEIPPSTTNDSTSSFEQASSRSSPRKSTSLLVRMKQQVSRHKMKDQVLDTEDQMDIDLDFVQHSMREDEQARSVPRASKISNHEP